MAEPEPRRPPADRLRRAATFLATACLFAFGLPGTAVFATLAILTSWLTRWIDAVGLCARLWAQCLLGAAGVRVEVELDPALSGGGGGGRVYVANHRSYFDIPILFAAAPANIRFVAKRSLFKIPIFGWSLAAGGFIPVDRADRSRARDVWAAAARRVAAGTSVVFFPEGTRSRDGAMLPFQRGAFLVALKAGVPVVPVGIEGARRVMPPGRFSATPGRVTVRFGAPVSPADYGVGGTAKLAERVRDEVGRLAGE